MNIVQIRAGLGNQMFQYAFYMALKQNQSDTKVDVSIFRYRPSHTGYELERLFGVHPDYATIEERNQMADVGKDWLSECRRAIGWKRKTTGVLIQEPDPAKGWCPQLLHAENCYIQGYWQTENYFRPISERVKETFQFCLPLSSADQSILQKIQSESSVSVHIRRGDYLKKRRRDEYEVCKEGYYKRAVEYIQNHVESPVFYVFSDEPEWGRKQNVFPTNTVFITGHTGSNAYIDMQLMSACHHHIIANSSFSWWGAWLGESADSIIVAPGVWFHHQPRPDVVPSRWIKIDAD